LHLVGYFGMNYTTMHGSTNIKPEDDHVVETCSLIPL
jgi:hypothetical protein